MYGIGNYHCVAVDGLDFYVDKVDELMAKGYEDVIKVCRAIKANNV